MKTILLSALALMCSCIVFAQGEGSAAEQYPGYRLVFHDEFDRNGRPNPEFWTYEHGYVRNHEAQFYREENAWCEDGCLVIEARKDDAGYPYTSASVISRGDTLAQPPTAWTYGRFEVREGATSGLEFMGVKMDAEKNRACRAKEAVLSAADSKVTVCCIPTDEELMIALDTQALC